MGVVHECVDFFWIKAVDLHADCEFAAVLGDQVVDKHASVDVLAEYLVNRETQVLLA